MTWVLLIGAALVLLAIVTGIGYLLAPYLRTLWLYFLLVPAIAGACFGVILAKVAPVNHEQYPGFMAFIWALLWGITMVAVQAGWVLGRDRCLHRKEGGMKRLPGSRGRALWDQQLDGYAPGDGAKPQS